MRRSIPRIHFVPCSSAFLALALTGSLACGGGGDGGEATPAEPPTATEAPTESELPSPAEVTTPDEATPDEGGTPSPPALSDALTAALAAIPQAVREQPAPGGADLVEGRRIYDAYCAACHGKEGRGDGPAAARLDPAPGDFTDPARLHRTTDGEKAWLVARGVGGGSAMSPFEAALTPQQIAGVLGIVQGFAPPPEAPAEPGTEASPAAPGGDNPPAE